MSETPRLTLGLGPIDDLPAGAGRRVAVGDHELAVFNCNGELFATSAVCHHQQAPLGDGHVADDDGVPTVTCPWHGWRYRLDTGERINESGTPLTTYRLAVRDGWILCLDAP